MSDSARLPAFQFYPADWQGNSNLKRCSHEEKGIWIDVMCILHDQAEYGIVRWPLADIATAIGASVKKLRGLVTKGVLKGVDSGIVEPFIYVPRSGRRNGDPVVLVSQQEGPIWYSSRMVKDAYVRRLRGASTRFGSDNDPSPDTSPKPAPKPAPKPPFGDASGDGSSSSSSSTDSPLPPEAGVKGGAKGKSATRIPSDWSPDDTARTYAQRLGFADWEVDAAAIEFREYWLSRADQKARRGDWNLTFKTRLRDIAADPKQRAKLKLVERANPAGETIDWSERMRLWRQYGDWYERWGPKPGEPGFQGPKDDLFTTAEVRQ
jgi:hypothetical protein